MEQKYVNKPLITLNEDPTGCESILDREWAIVDIETSDAYLKDGRIIEIAIIIVKNLTIIEKYETLINPNTYISPFIENLTGISNEDVYKAPTFESIALDIYKKLENRLFIAHNVSFDYNFIRDEFSALNINFNEDKLCSVKLSKSVYPFYKRHNLDSIKERHNLNIENRHRAYDDAYAVYEFINKIYEEFSAPTLISALNHNIKAKEHKKH